MKMQEKYNCFHCKKKHKDDGVQIGYIGISFQISNISVIVFVFVGSCKFVAHKERVFLNSNQQEWKQ